MAYRNTAGTLGRRGVQAAVEGPWSPAPAPAGADCTQPRIEPLVYAEQAASLSVDATGPAPRVSPSGRSKDGEDAAEPLPPRASMFHVKPTAAVQPTNLGRSGHPRHGSRTDKSILDPPRSGSPSSGSPSSMCPRGPLNPTETADFGVRGVGNGRISTCIQAPSDTSTG